MPSNCSYFSYINKFLRLKQQADGWPSKSKTAAEKEQYLCEYEEKEKIKLDPDKIAKNPGLRTISKLCLNSFWGKVSIL